jgi:hypothetical protein
MRPWISLFIALLLIPLAIGYAAFSARTTDVVCNRAGGQVSCSEREAIGPYEAWSKSVEDIKIARDMSGSSDANGVVAETNSGEQIQLTSTFLDDNTQADISNRIHQFIFVQRDQDTLAFSLGPSLLAVAPGAVAAVGLAIWAVVSVVQIVRRLTSGR